MLSNLENLGIDAKIISSITMNRIRVILRTAAILEAILDFLVMS